MAPAIPAARPLAPRERSGKPTNVSNIMGRSWPLRMCYPGAPYLYHVAPAASGPLLLPSYPRSAGATTSLPIAYLITPLPLPPRSPCRLATPHRRPTRRLSPRAPRTQDHKTKTGGLGLLPPWSIYWAWSKSAFLASIQWLLNHGDNLARLIHDGAEGSLLQGNFLGRNQEEGELREGAGASKSHFSIRMLPETTSGLILGAPIPQG
jgi:hypothetical protein